MNHSFQDSLLITSRKDRLMLWNCVFCLVDVKQGQIQSIKTCSSVKLPGLLINRLVTMLFFCSIHIITYILVNIW